MKNGKWVADALTCFLVLWHTENMMLFLVMSNTAAWEMLAIL
jgi:hypothetical protein